MNDAAAEIREALDVLTALSLGEKLDDAAPHEASLYGYAALDSLVALVVSERERADRAETALREIAEQQPTTLAMIEDNGFVFDEIGREPGNWKHLAFSIYADLCETDTTARAALSGSDEQKHGLADDTEEQGT